MMSLRSKFEYTNDGVNRGYLVTEKETKKIIEMIDNGISMREIFQRITGYSMGKIEAIIFVVAYCETPFVEVTI